MAQPPDRRPVPGLDGPPAWHALTPEEVAARLGASPHGLSRAEARARLERYGPNRLDETPPPSALLILLHQFRGPLIAILVIAAVVTLLLGDYVDSAVIAAVLTLNAIIGFTQERQAEQSVRSLMRLLAPHARVIREGREWDIESRELVPGDLVLLETGARISADLRLISTTALMIDESLLTGESLPVTARVEPMEVATAVADRACMAYAGAIVTRGRGRGYVVATGAATELGAIATRVRGEPETATPLQQRMARFARVIGVTVGVSSILAFVIGLILGESITTMFKVAVALAVAAVPEGLPVVFTITLALGVRRMARRQAIIRRLPAVETLGSTTVIGSDKTGTLTENRMTVQAIWAGGRTYDVTGDGETSDVLELAEHRPLYLTLLTGVLSNEAVLYRTEHGIETRGDPTEAALLVAAARLGLEPAEVQAAYVTRAEAPFEPERQYSASVRAHEGARLLFVKGAPERLMRMATHLLTDMGPVPLDPVMVQQAAHDLAVRGLRVLGMAYRVLPEAPSEEVEAALEPGNLVFLGLQGMLDPPRAGVREAIAGCQTAGIRVIMITGDHAATARSIGRDLGIADAAATVLTGVEIASLTDEELRDKVSSTSIYARVAPEQKYQVVQALRAQGEVVAVTGDGVNDAPALKAADIGIAMGKSGTDVAREAADMVLADDNFVSIHAAVEEGRVTFDNLRKVTFFLISTGAASILTLLTSLLLGWPLPFLPAQLLWLNLVTNGLQDVALAFEPGEEDVGKRPPRPREEGIISPLLWERTVISGIVIAIGTLALFWWELTETGVLSRAQTVALTTMVLFQVFQAGNARSESQSVFRRSPLLNPFLFVATAAALLVHIVALYLPFTQFVLRVEPVDLEAWVRMGLVALTIIVVVEAHKWLRRGRGLSTATTRGR